MAFVRCCWLSPRTPAPEVASLLPPLVSDSDAIRGRAPARGFRGGGGDSAGSVARAAVAHPTLKSADFDPEGLGPARAGRSRRGGRAGRSGPDQDLRRGSAGPVRGGRADPEENLLMRPGRANVNFHGTVRAGADLRRDSARQFPPEARSFRSPEFPPEQRPSGAGVSTGCEDRSSRSWMRPKGRHQPGGQSGARLQAKQSTRATRP